MSRTETANNRQIVLGASYPHLLQLETRQREVERELELRRLRREARTVRRRGTVARPVRALWALLTGR